MYKNNRSIECMYYNIELIKINIINFHLNIIIIDFVEILMVQHKVQIQNHIEI